jgi:hypothetical protein
MLMVKMLFVHGTGVRSADYERLLEQVRRGMSGSGIQVDECLWGDHLGVRLHGNGSSIPPDLPHLAVGDVTPEDEDVALWSVLYQDPVYELRLLQNNAGAPGIGGGFVPGGESPTQMLQERMQSLARLDALSEETRAALVEAGFRPEELARAGAAVLRSGAYQALLPHVQEPLTPYRFALARAVVAELLADRPEDRPGSLGEDLWGAPAPPSLDGELRDRLVATLAEELGTAELGLRGWLVGQFTGLASRWGTSHVRRNRRVLSQSVYPGVGDILLYQARGQAARHFIRAQVEAANGPVILLGHSLGGIMCVDLLVEQDLSRKQDPSKGVKLLVTVGSQSPFFYELDVLTSLRWGEPLPGHFPERWMNIYDRRDFLSYVGNGVFPGRVRDEAVDSRQPFPQSHSAYWTNKHLWHLVRTEWATIAG